MTSTALAFCPSAPPSAEASRPGPGNFAYTLGLPGGTFCLGTARGLVRQVLDQHQLADMAELAELAVSELLTNALTFTPGHATHLSMRWRFGVLRLTVFDEHPSHCAFSRPVCRRRRREGLSLLDTVVSACGGICGLAEVELPLGGSKAWVVLPREAAALYAEL
ncbi:hypothetical protein GCM10010218_64730 [Streptomyces mashuensis]|uniref:ATP-binding protein n=1 Tax=Streptomyces mashuensis TaxID=33904 RepID=A0A919EGE6_9ACTN|nr:ATP-binding protein [Streptomyces mashuensis]GHF74721.1 hypothetical protein GCM10010218_64730 [Streptomyces mashuensis]